MKKKKTSFFCSNCGTESPKWIGKCPSCSEWNTYVEEVVSKTSQKKTAYQISKDVSSPLKITDIQEDIAQRIDCRDKELNQILGGGLVLGSLVLLGGEPGIGKSTLALQLVLNAKNLNVAYISGEESAQQIKMRSKRIGVTNENCWIINETNLEKIFNHLEKIHSQLVVIDSIQTIYTQMIESLAGSISQVKECAGQLLKYAKIKNIPIVVIGHITKDGQLAGPKVLEHIVDVVLQLEGDEQQFYRILRSTKNRYGSTAEMGMYEMKNNGIHPVKNFSSILLSQRSNQLSGITTAASIEGARPFMIEVQALVSSAVYGVPQRSTTGFDFKRLNMLLAVLENRVGFKLANKDVFLNIAGGINVKDTAIDLAVIVAILSSNLDIAVSPYLCFAGEVGLSGEIRPNNRIDIRIKEAEKIGLNKIYTSNYKGNIQDIKNIEIVKVSKVADVFRALFKQ